jgi:hypothetical protein
LGNGGVAVSVMLESASTESTIEIRTNAPITVQVFLIANQRIKNGRHLILGLRTCADTGVVKSGRCCIHFFLDIIFHFV